MRPAMILDDLTIRQNNGLFSLNDLHAASGGEDRHRPGYFLTGEQTKALIAQLDTAGFPAVKTKEGKHGGSYACRELVIAYASWISAAFHLKVIRVFLDAAAPKVPPPAKHTAEAARAFNAVFRTMRLIGCDKNAAAISANQTIRKISGVDLLELSGNSHLLATNQQSLFFTPTELGQRLGNQSARAVNLLLAETGLQSKESGQWLPTDKGLPHARIFDTGKKHSDSTPVQQVKWSADVLPLIRIAERQDKETV